ncbi:hypothetical protein LAZ67_17001194 [Cordylochernes scorpioides]|uniref:Tc1-like transposase DDE domain-containing protein n=1 Tax=Cordylochernes scorpioides TaxID=51811 RepID=A0ABY6LD75_9ARAC|nr:hypothetical protein LAZ67_17001194 [Cordylochernes scorpioides]
MNQRTCIKFSVKNEIKCVDAFRMLSVAYGEATLDRNNVYRWYRMFSEGREDVNDEERAGRPSTSTTDEKINEVEKMILANRRITVREVAEDLNISIGSCHSIFINDLGMRRVAAKFKVITGDEAWVYGYDVETKAQSSQWKLPHEPRPKKARQVRSNVKVLLTVFFDCRGVVHHEFLPQGRTANKEYYLQVMRNFREAIRQKRPDLWKNKNWLLQHDNAPAHTSLLVRDFLAKNNTLMMPQPPYSPELAPCVFILFPKQKKPMKGRRYATLDEIKTASKEELKKILKNDFLKCFENWKNRWHKCIISHGDYFEGDKIGFHSRVKAKTSLQDNDVPIDDTTQSRSSRRKKKDAKLLPYGSCDPQLEIIVDTDVDLTCFCQGFHRSLGTLSLVPLRPFSCGVKSGFVVRYRQFNLPYRCYIAFLELPLIVILMLDSLNGDSRRVRVWRRRGERSNPAAIVERPTVRLRGILVWGAIAYDSWSPLLRIQGTMTAQRYVDDVLRPVILPYLQGVPNALYQQDNARPHTARISQQALQDVQMLPWPPYSPDLSLIEHV